VTETQQATMKDFNHIYTALQIVNETAGSDA